MFNFTFSILTPEPLKHFGVCDASAAIPLGKDQFIVGNDEADEDLGNLLRVYSSQESGKVTTLPISINEFVNTRKEIDLEAVTELNGVIYWITSHGRNSSGEIKPKRHQLFATKLTGEDNVLEQVGQSYTRLLYWDLLTESKLKDLRENEVERLAPKLGGINIEGLTARPEGDLLIGFRSPLTENKALLVPLKNPLKLMTRTSTKAQFGEPILLDLGGLGVRSIEYWSVIQAYIIIAGEVGSGDRFALYLWSGNSDENPELIDLTLPTDFRPESILFYPHLSDRFQLLSDDGTIQRVEGQQCKEIKDSTHPEKYFRSLWIQVESK
ncbi:MAG: DUF3616 domain-containing protein [Merismopediaceae bacterium]|nr:DUF3616 domain-containing protein [Merismopediaceae bacterium]